MKLWEAKVLARRFGCTIAPRPDGEFRVNLAEGGTEETAYYTTDLNDALNTAAAMSGTAKFQSVQS